MGGMPFGRHGAALHWGGIPLGTYQEKLLGYIAVIAVIVAIFSLFCIL